MDFLQNIMSSDFILWQPFNLIQTNPSAFFIIWLNGLVLTIFYFLKMESIYGRNLNYYLPDYAIQRQIHAESKTKKTFILIFDLLVSFYLCYFTLFSLIGISAIVQFLS